MSAPGRKNLRRRGWRKMYDLGWTQSAADDTLRSRIAHAAMDYMNRPFYDWGHPVMWLVGRNDSGSAGAPRGRDLWWIPTDYVEGIATSLVADFEQRFGCYVTTQYADVRATVGDIAWRIYDLQDDGRVVKVGLWPNSPDHKGRMQPLPWQELNVGLFLHWYLWDHKAKAQWFGFRTRLYYRALHSAVHLKVPFSCQQVPPRHSGGYNHWHCTRRRGHPDDHRYRAMVWSGAPGDKVRRQDDTAVSA